MEAQCKEAAALVKKIASIHAALSKLPPLSPSSDADALFTTLVAACVTSSPAVNVTSLGPEAGRMRDDLVRLCADAEARLEAQCADALAALDGDPLDHLGRLFPFYDSYARLGELEHALLSRHAPDHLAVPARVAFLGSGSLPLSPLLVAARHMTDAAVDCYDRCAAANDRASRLLLRPRADDDEKRGGLAERMSFRTADVEDLTRDLAAYDVVLLAAPVGVSPGQKARVVAHLGEHMADGAVHVARSAHGARGFLCAVLEPADVARGGFQVLAVHHPDDRQVINSIIVARKVAAVGGLSQLAPPVLSPPCKCCEPKTPRRRLLPTTCHLDAMNEIRRRAW
ncbi:hypothetical protein CFC21_037964 [Triticum aestivum]|uniref:Nicotianamine synthase n=2 Tax=Triticum aestivum TaxID=4565 RepID=A0A9R1JQJ1_WHEAT|nr:nicotianamine synthase-like 5 protein [Triticum aestivum]KAF7025807.1 hypothetical protein CFC21_037964 [Triticum aestivum]